jgi:S-formylglutathione hydrolase FrmB
MLMSRRLLMTGAVAALALLVPVVAHPETRGRLLTERLASTVLRDNLVGLDTNRVVKIYLPPGYETSGQSYPVVYFLHNIGWDAERMFQDGNVVSLMERAFANGVVGEFILVAADYSTKTAGSVYENSATSGRWLDFTVDELVPFIDERFRTRRHRDSRALVGDFMGGRGALQLAMLRADLFGSVYALHPVATGTGQLPWPYVEIDWRRLHAARSPADLAGTGRTQLFLTISQAFLPNPNRPPFYCGFFMELRNGEPAYHADNAVKLKKGFLLEETLDQAAANLRSLRGLAFDWGRFDTVTAHVVANQTFSRKLEDLAIPHEAEEYRGGPWDRNWTADGRFYTRVLPFLSRALVFRDN